MRGSANGERILDGECSIIVTRITEKPRDKVTFKRPRPHIKDSIGE